MLLIHRTLRLLLSVLVGSLVFLIDHALAADWSGDIPDGTVWPAGEVQRIVGNARVPEGFTLTIEQGAIIKFNFGTSLSVDGVLSANGSVASPILLTSDTDDTGGDTNGDGGATTPGPGFWNHLEVRPSGSASLTWVDVRYGGDVSFGIRGNLSVNGGSLDFENGSVHESDSAGIYMASAEPVLEGVDFQDNRLSAMRMDVDSQPSISVVSFSNNGVNGVLVDGGTLSLSRNWDDPEAVYSLSGDVAVPEGVTLSVGPGQVIKPNHAVDLFIQGILDVNGTANDPVYFVAASDDSHGGDTNNDGDATTPGVGAWNRIDVAETGSASLDWTHIAHGGDVSFSSRGSLRINGGGLAFNNGSVRESDSAGIYMVSAESLIIGVHFEDNRLSAMRMDVDSQPAISAVGFSNNGVNGVLVDPGTLSHSRTWDDPEAVYSLSGDVVVPEGLTLSVGPGQVIKPNHGVDLFIQGVLDANGSLASPVYFVASSDDSHGGDTNNDADQTVPGVGAWNRIDVAETGNASLDWTHIAHGGDVSFSSRGSLRVNGGGLAFNNGSVRESDSAGIYMVSAEPSISGVVFEGNRFSAMRMDVDSQPSISAVSFSNNGVNGVLVDPGTLSLSRTWDDPEAVYSLSGDIVVPEGVTLSVGPGQIIKPNSAVDLFIQGVLDVNGSAGSPVFFVAASDDSHGGDTNNDGDATTPGVGAWNRIDIAPTGNASLDWTHIAHGGDESFGTRGSLSVSGGSLDFANGSVRESDSAGIYMASAEPVINSVDFQDNRRSAMRMDVDSQPSISAVSFSNNGVNGVSVDPGTLSLNRSWDDPEAVYSLSGDVVVPEGVTLSLGPGQIVKPNSGVDLFVNGALTTAGSIDQPVIFTASVDDSHGGDTNNDGDDSTPGPGWWNRLLVSATGSLSLEFTQISYAGDRSFSSRAGVELSGGTALIQNSIISGSDSSGVYVGGGSADLVNSLLYDNNSHGLETGGSGSANAVNNTINGNLSGVAINGSHTTLMNNIISHNSRAGIEVVGGSSSDILYNDVYNPGATLGNYTGLADLTGIDGNLSADPIFANAGAGLFQILSSSPAIDSANSTGAPPLDFFGNARFDDPGVENIGGGVIPYYDMGAIERQEGSDPVNLVIESVDINPAGGEIGDTVTISWTVRNLGTGPAPAPWSDAVFASPDAAWDINDERLDETLQLTTLFPGESYSRSIDTEIPPVMPGELNFIVRVDYREQAREVEESNEEVLTLTVDIPVIPLGGQVQTTLTPDRPERYFQVPLSQDEVFDETGFPHVVGELSVGLDDQDDLGTNELFLGANHVPSRSAWDVRSVERGPDQAATSFLSDPQTVFVLARAAALPAGDSIVTLSADIEPYSITGFSPATVGNAGKATLAVDGVSFSGIESVSLVAPDQSEIEAEAIYFEDSRRLYATFDTRGLDPGSYRIRIAQSLVRVDLDPGEFTVPDTVEVSYTEETLTTTSLNTLEIVAGGQPEIGLVVSLPSRMRAAREFSYTLTYSNRGNLDAAGLMLVLSGTGGELFDPDMDYAHTGDLPLLAVSTTGPAGILRPGQSETVELRGIAPNAVGQKYTLTVSEASATDGEGPDFDGFISELGYNPSLEPWSIVIAHLEARLGETWTSFRLALAEFVTNHAEITGERPRSVRGLLNGIIDESLLEQGPFPRAGPGASIQVIEPSTTPPEDRVTSNNPRRDMTGKVVLGAPGTGTDGWPNRILQYRFPASYIANLPQCAAQNVSYSSSVVNATQIAFSNRAGSFLALQHINLWLNAANWHQQQVVHLTGSLASDMFLSVKVVEGVRTFGSIHQNSSRAAIRMINREIPLWAPMLPAIPDFDVNAEIPDWGTGGGRSASVWSPFTTSTWFYPLAAAFGRMQGAAATVKDVYMLESETEIFFAGLIRYAFIDRFEFDATDARKGFFEKNFYVEEWCSQGSAAGFDTMVIVEKKFSNRYIPKDSTDPELSSVTPGTEGGVKDDDDSDLVGGWDPNDKLGPAGFGDPTEGLIEPGDELFYMVRFENDPDLASAPAQRVVVVDVLDENLDLGTFRLMSFGFGDTVVETPPDLQAFDGHVDSTNLDGSDLRVNLSASLDTLNRTVTWVFDSIDPDTGGAPTGIDDGFLPVNDETGRGEGYVTFRVRPRPDAPLGTRIFNDAEIFFDQNEPIVTPTTVHTISINDTIFADGFE